MRTRAPAKPFCDPDEADRLAKSVMPYIYKKSFESTLGRLQGRQANDLKEQLVSAGLHGVAIALTKFDPSYGVKFFTYCKFWIDQQIQTAMRKRAQQHERLGTPLSLDCEIESRSFSGEFLAEKAEPSEEGWDHLLSRLTDKRLRKVVELRYRHDMTYHEISKAIRKRGEKGLSRERIRQLLARALWMMKSALPPPNQPI